MLETLRNSTKGWFAALMIFVLVGSFGMWGVQDMLNLTEQPRVAEVGGEDITPERFQRDFSRFIGQMSRSSGSEMSTQQAKTEGLDRVALDRLVNKLAILHKSRAMGLNVSSAQIVEALRPIQGMVDSKGKLNPDALIQLARTNDMSQGEFIDLITADLIRNQMLRSVAAGVVLPPGLENALNRFRLERRIVEYVEIDQTRAGEIKDPSETELRKYYNGLADARYSTPELRSVVFVSARIEDVAASVKVSEQEIVKVYEANRRVYETPEKRVLEQIKFKTEKGARNAKAKLDAGASFEAIAKAEGFGPTDIKLGEVSKTDTAIPATAFELPLATISDPVKGTFGWVIIRAISATPGTSKSLDEVREEIHKRIYDGRAKDALSDLTNKLEDTLGTGATLEEAAVTHKIPIRSVDLTSEGTDNNGTLIEGLPAGGFLQQIFAADAGTDPELYQTEEGTYYEFRIDKISTRAKKPFDLVRTQALSDWRDEQVSMRLKAFAAALVKRGEKGERMSSIAASLGVPLVISDPMPRYGKSPTFSEKTVTTASNTKKGNFFSGTVALGQGLVVGQVTVILFQDEAADAPMRAAYTQQLLQSFVGDVVDQFESGVRQEIGASIDEKRFQAFHNNE